MITLIVLSLVALVAGKVLVFSARAAFGVGRVLLSLLFLPLVLIFAIAKGLLTVAVPVLAVIGLFALLGGKNCRAE